MPTRKRATPLPSAMGEAAKMSLEIGQASAVTLSYRLPMLAAGGWWPTFETMLEANRMVTEKVAAALEGSAAASAAILHLHTRAMLRNMGAMSLLAGYFSVAVAAAAPTHRRVRANARRLAR